MLLFSSILVTYNTTTSLMWTRKRWITTSICGICKYLILNIVYFVLSHSVSTIRQLLQWIYILSIGIYDGTNWHTSNQGHLKKT